MFRVHSPEFRYMGCQMPTYGHSLLALRQNHKTTNHQGIFEEVLEASIPPTRDPRLLRKGVVLDLNGFCPEEAEWSRWLATCLSSECGACDVGAGPLVLQKSLWFALLWRDVYANSRSFLWGLGVHGYSHRWWEPQVDRFCT